MKNKDIVAIIALVGCIVMGIFLRIFQFGHIPIGTYWDETAMIIDASAIAATGHDMHGNSWLQAIFPSYGDFKLPMYIWLSTLVFRAINNSEVAIRLPSLLAGVATIGLAALIAGELAKYWPRHQRRIFQLASASVVSLSFWAILFSRTGFEGHLAQLWMGLSMYSLLKSKNNSAFWIVAGVFGSLATWTYYSARFIWPILWFTMVLPQLFSTLTNHKERSKLLLKQVLPALGAICIFFSAMYLMVRSPLYPASEVFRLSSDSILNQAPFVAESNLSQFIEGHTFVGRIALHRYLFQAKSFADNFASNMSLDFLFFSGDHNLRHGTGMHGLFPIVFAPCLLFGLLGLFKHHRSTLFLLLIWWFVSLIPASVPYDVPHALRTLNALVPLALLIGYGMTTLLLAPLKHRVILYKVFFICLFIEMLAFSQYLFVIYPVTSASEWQAGYTELAQYATSNQGAVNRFWINSGDGRFFLWLLAFGTYSASDIQKLPWQDYQLTQLGTIELSDFVYTREGFPDVPFALAGRRKEISDNLALLRATPQIIIPILDRNQQEQFIVTYFNLSSDQLNHVKK